MRRAGFKWVCISGALVGAIMCVSATGVIVINVTDSLPQNGFFMLRYPKVTRVGNYAAFEAPAALSEGFEDLHFVKRIVGVPGDLIISTEEEVCVNDYCRQLQPEMIERGFLPLQSGVVGIDKYVMFGDAANSLDSRYDVLGLVARDELFAVGVPLPIPHWREIQSWFN